MNQDIDALKAKLEELRASNRKTSAENVIMTVNIEQLTEEEQEIKKLKEEAENKQEKQKKSIDEEYSKDGSQQEKLRAERKRLIMVEIHKFTDENKKLMNEIREIKEKTHMNEMQIDRLNKVKKINKILKKGKGDKPKVSKKSKAKEVDPNKPNVNFSVPVAKKTLPISVVSKPEKKAPQTKKRNLSMN